MELVFNNITCRRGTFTLDIPEFAIRNGDKIALLGENGCGKSTLLSIFAGILQADSGEISYNGGRWDKLNPRQRAKHMAYLPQTTELLFNLTVGELIELAIDEKTKPDKLVLEAMEMNSYIDRIYHSLSGGEQRRAMLARVLSQQKAFTLLDEPTAALDLRHSAQCMRYISAQNMVVMAAIHDINLALRYFNRFLLMKEGQILYDTRKDELTTAMLSEVYGIGFARSGDHFIHEL
jgi:iron complex transport system ATP-binding protein